MKARGNVENWLGLVEESMAVSLRKLTKLSLADFEIKPRHEWATQHPSQVNTYIVYCYMYSGNAYFYTNLLLYMYVLPMSISFLLLLYVCANG